MISWRMSGDVWLIAVITCNDKSEIREEVGGEVRLLRKTNSQTEQKANLFLGIFCICFCLLKRKGTFNVMLRFRSLISRDTLVKVYKAFILPHFYYCSSVWHFCGARNTDKLDVLNKRILRFILQLTPTTIYLIISTLLLYTIDVFRTF